MYTTARTTYTNINDTLTAKTTYWTQRKGGKSESEQVTANMEAKAKAERKARGRVQVQEEQF